MNNLSTSIVVLAAFYSLFAVTPARAADEDERPTFAAVHALTGGPWVELARLEDEPRGRAVTIADDFLHEVHVAIPGARPLRTHVRLYGADGTCEGLLGRPAYVGVFHGDGGFGGEPDWLEAAPVRGCRGGFYSVAVFHPGAGAGLARDVVDVRPDQGQFAEIVQTRMQARVELSSSEEWIATRGEWASSYPASNVTTLDSVFVLGREVWGLAEDSLQEECGVTLSVRRLVHRHAGGRLQTVTFPGRESERVEYVGDLDGDGDPEMVLGSGALRVVSLRPDGTADVRLDSNGIAFFGCPC